MNFPASRLILSVFLIGAFHVSMNVEAARIDAQKGKVYHLSEAHGPWMVMVASFQEPPPEMKVEGKSPEQAANELVYELRKKGIPAYIFKRGESKESVQTVDRLSQRETKYYRLDSEVSVLAGNYQSISNDTDLSRRTLQWIKKYTPDSLNEGAIIYSTPGQPKPLSGAFLTINPLLSPEDVKRRQRDPVILKWNSGVEHSLLSNPGKYSVVVASFYGRSVAKVNDSSFFKTLQNFDLDLQKDSGLGKAYHQSWQVMTALREKGLDAYVFHDHNKSVVTIGAFNDPRDPEALKIVDTFRARYKQNPDTGQVQLVSELLVLPSREGSWMCTFDPEPKLMEVPYK